MSDPATLRQQMIAAALGMRLPLVQLDPTCEWVPSIDEAATKALANAPATDFETGGALYRNADGLFCYSIPVGNRNDAHIKFGVPPQDGLTLAGLYHTHPGRAGLRRDSSERFSDDDREMAKRLKIASYIRALKNDVIRKFDPATKQDEVVK